MGIYKIMIGIMLSYTLAGCSDTVPKQQYNEILNEYKALKELTDESRQMNLKQAKVISKTVSDLAEISGSTLILRQNLEAGKADITQAEKIKNSLSVIKAKLNQLDNINSNNQELVNTIKSLNIIIVKKEQEIKELLSIINTQAKTIVEKENVILTHESKIEQQSSTISNQEQQLRRLLERQTESLYRAGIEFEKIASQKLEVSNPLFKKSNTKKVEAYKKEILNKALIYYELAASMGHAKAQLKVNKLRQVLNY